MKNIEENSPPKVVKNYYRHDYKKQATFKSPDIQKLQEVKIDERTKLYIALDADPEQARKRYLTRLETKGTFSYSARKAAAPAAPATQVKEN
jgi:hypothetical protein